MNTIVKKRLIYAICIILYLFLLFCNILLPRVSDDLCQLEMAQEGISSGISQYLHSNSRLGEILLSSWVGGWPTFVFDIVNAGAGTLFFILVLLLMEGRWLSETHDVKGKIVIIVTYVLSFTTFCSVFLWTSGSVNYLWGYNLLALHWLPYRFFWKTIVSKKECDECSYNHMSNSKLSLFVLISFFAGWSSEQVGVMSLFVHLCLITWAIRSRRVKLLPTYYWIGIFALFLGFLVLYLAPGPKMRAGLYGDFLTITQLLSLPVPKLFVRCFDTLFNAMPKYSFDFLVIVLSAYCLFKSRRRTLVFINLTVVAMIVLICRYCLHISYIFMYARYVILLGLLVVSIIALFNKEYLWESILYILFCLSLLSTIQIVGLIPSRAKFAESMILMVISVRFIRRIRAFVSLTQLNLFACVIPIAILIILSDFSIKQHQMNIDVETSLIMGKKEIIVSNHYFLLLLPYLGDWANPTSKPENWVNEAYARYFGAEKFILCEVTSFEK